MIGFQLDPKGIDKVNKEFLEGRNDDLGGAEILRSSPVMINVPTYDGSGETVHPDVLRIDAGFGPQKFRYWLAINPYPGSDDSFENPSVFGSHDGVLWELPEGAPNPIEVPVGVHYADPDMVFFDGTLYLFFRQGYTTRLTKSSDGVTWSESQLVINQPTCGLLSPTVIHTGGEFKVWYVDTTDAITYTLATRTSVDGETWSDPTGCTVNGVPEGRNLWHQDITISQSGGLVGIFNISVGAGADGLLHYGYSDDGGLTWTISPNFLDRIHSFEGATQYRATLLPVPNMADVYEMWYSGRSSTNVWRTVYLPVVMIDNQLYPIASTSRKNIQWDSLSAPSAAIGKILSQKINTEELDAKSGRVSLQQLDIIDGVAPTDTQFGGIINLGGSGNAVIHFAPATDTGYWRLMVNYTNGFRLWRRNSGGAYDLVLNIPKETGTVTVKKLGVANSADGSTLGTVVKKVEIFSATGTSLGFIPVYDTIE